MEEFIKQVTDNPFADLTNLIAATLTIITIIIPIAIIAIRKILKKGEFYIGIDIGSDTIKCCIVDYQAFSKAILNPYNAETIIKNSVKDSISKENPVKKEGFDKIYQTIAELIREILEKTEGKYTPIRGIGIGLPGMVKPEDGILRHAPSFGEKTREFITGLKGQLTQEPKDWNSLRKLMGRRESNVGDNFIRIDNDVRCATRFFSKFRQEKNLVCIFIGNGVGSGIVLNGSMIYGKDFSAGEIGHSIISNNPELFNEELKICHCRQAGYHWEMYVSSYGVINLMKHYAKEKFDEFQSKYPDLQTEELTSKIREEYNDGYCIVQAINEEFLEYTAIGVANCINILNPEIVILGGGMIRAFLYDSNGNKIDTNIRELKEKIEKYALSIHTADNIIIKSTEKQEVASIGAALIFKDKSYSEYIDKINQKHKNKKNRKII